jgi:hypothetical protein
MIFIVEGYFTWKLSGGNLYTCIRPNQEQPRKMQLQVPGRNRTCGSAIRIVLFCFVDKNTIYLVKISNGSYKTTVIPKKMCSNNTLLYFEWISIRLQQIVKCKQLIYQLKCTVIEFKTSDALNSMIWLTPPMIKKTIEFGNNLIVIVFFFFFKHNYN